MLKNLLLAIVVGAVIGIVCGLAGLGEPWNTALSGVGGGVAVALIWARRIHRER